MRKTARMTLSGAAEKLDKARSSLGRIEQGKTRADIHLVRSMMDLYGVFIPGIEDQVRRANLPGWWVAYGVKDMGYIDVETEAAQVRELALLNVPGLLQTEAYMRAFFAEFRIPRTTQVFENQVAVRLIRQLRLTDSEDPLELSALIDEGALRKPVGGVEVMRQQLRHLIMASKAASVTIRVLPDSLGGHDGMNGAFTLLGFHDPDDPVVLYVPYATGSLHIEDLDEVRDAKVLWEHLMSRALDPDESIALIERVLAEQYGPE
jgi:transcriptional regulator with XRE-family HTH domain